MLARVGGRRAAVVAGCALALGSALCGCGSGGDPLGGAPDVRGLRIGEAERILRAAGTDFSFCLAPDSDRAPAREFLFVARQDVFEDEDGRITVLVLGAMPTSKPPKDCAFPRTGNLH